MRIFGFFLILICCMSCLSDDKETEWNWSDSLFPQILPNNNDAVNITSTGAKLSADLYREGEAICIEKGFLLDTIPAVNIERSLKIHKGSNIASFSHQLTNLKPNTIYYYNVYVNHCWGNCSYQTLSYGSEKSFTTLD